MKNEKLVRCKHCGKVIAIKEAYKGQATQVGYGFYCDECIALMKDIEQDIEGTFKKHGFIHTTLLHGDFLLEDFDNFLSLKYNFSYDIEANEIILVSSPEDGACRFSATLRQMNIEPQGTQVHRVARRGVTFDTKKVANLVNMVNEKFNYNLFSVRSNCIMFNFSFDNGWEAFKNDCINCRAIFIAVEKFQNGKISERKAFENIVKSAKVNETRIQSVKLGRY